jgi:hypothetical protein
VLPSFIFFFSRPKAKGANSRKKLRNEPNLEFATDRIAGELIGKDLDGDFTLQLQVASTVNLAHSTADNEAQ